MLSIAIPRVFLQGCRYLKNPQPRDSDKRWVSNRNIAAFTGFSRQPAAPHSSLPVLIEQTRGQQCRGFESDTHTHTRISTDRFLRIPFEQEYTTGGWITNGQRDLQMSFWPILLWKKFLFFAQAFISGLRSRWPVLKIEVILVDVIAGGITRLLPNFSSCKFLLKPSIRSSLDGYRRGRTFQLYSGPYNLFSYYYRPRDFHLSLLK